MLTGDCHAQILLVKPTVSTKSVLKGAMKLGPDVLGDGSCLESVKESPTSARLELKMCNAQTFWRLPMHYTGYRRTDTTSWADDGTSCRHCTTTGGPKCWRKKNVQPLQSQIVANFHLVPHNIQMTKKPAHGLDLFISPLKGPDTRYRNIVLGW